MITFAAGQTITWPADFIGLNVNDDGTIWVFVKGDETSPEWLALHPPADGEQSGQLG